jgi:hypothetical protein
MLTPVLNTVTAIRRRLSTEGHPVEAYQVIYAIKKLRLVPVGRAGCVPVYDDAAVALVRAEIERIAAWRSSSTAVPAGVNVVE